jgi:CBS domain-containing protein
MKVKDIMTRDVQTCSPESNLTEATMLMWDHDCGSIPVVNSEGKVVSMITDRDISVSLAMKNRLSSEVKVREAMSKTLFSCGEDNDVKSVLDTMRVHQIRRLPVVDTQGKLRGILSINDLILEAGPKNADLSQDKVMETLKAICAPHRKEAPREPVGSRR